MQSYTYGSLGITAVQNAATSMTGVATTIPENLLCIIAVINHNATPANLATPTLSWAVTSGPTPTFVKIADLTITIASVIRRLSVWHTMVAGADAVGTLTVNGNASTQDWNRGGVYVGGANTHGTANGVGAVGVVATANSGNTSQTSLPITTGAGGDSGVVSIFANANTGAAGMSPRTNWTEQVDSGIASAGELQIQTIDYSDSTADVTAGSQPIMGVSIEILPLTPRSDATFMWNAGTAGSASFQVTTCPMLKDSNSKISNFIVVGFDAAATGRTNMTATARPVDHLTITRIATAGPGSDGAANRYLVLFQVDMTNAQASGTPVITFAPTGGSGNVAMEIIGFAVSNVDASIVQFKVGTFTNTSAPSQTFDNALTDRNNTVIGIWNTTGVANSLSGGTQAIYNADVAGYSNDQWVITWRPNGDTSPGLGGSSATQDGTQIVMELSPAPPLDQSPVITLDSPAEGPVANNAAVNISVDDADEDLDTALVWVIFSGQPPELAYDGTALQSGYLGASTASVDGLGNRDFHIVRDDGWEGDFTVEVRATDGAGHVTTADFDFTVADPTNVAPVITLNSPAEGPVASNATISISVDDDDSDLDTAVIWITFAGHPPEVMYNGSAISTGYLGGSVASVDGSGNRDFTIDRDDGWPGDFTVEVRATDEAGHTTIETYNFTVAAPAFDPCVNDGVAPVVTVEAPLPYNNPASPMDATDFLQFTITDDDADPGVGGGLERVVPIIMWPDGTGSLIHNGDEFLLDFRVDSTRVAITGGYRYLVRPNGGRWRKQPRLLPFAYDLTGKEAA